MLKQLLVKRSTLINLAASAARTGQ